MELVQPLRSVQVGGRPLPVTHAALISDSETDAWAVVIVDATNSAYWLDAIDDECPLTFTTLGGVRVGGRVSLDLSKGSNVRLVGLSSLLHALAGRGTADLVPVTAA